MTAYVVATLRFTDEARYRAYQAKFAEVFSKFDGCLLAADEAPLVLEGDRPNKVVIMRFRDSRSAHQFLNSDAYKAISEVRRGGATSQAVLVSGLAI